MKIKKSLVAVFIAFATLGMSGLGEAQHVRSTAHRSYYSGHHHYRGHGHYRSGYHGGVRIGVGVGWGGYYGYGYGGYVGYRHYPTYYGGYYGGVAVRYSTPRFIHYPPRAAVVVTPPIEQVVPAPAPPREVIKLKPGETIERGNVVIANIDGKIVILQAVDNGETQGQ